MHIEMYPLDRVVIDGMPIHLGMGQADVEHAIGAGQPAGKRYYYYDGEMAIDYNTDGRVEFVEFLGGPDGLLHPCINGVSAFEAPADELTAMLTDKNAGEVIDSERGYAYSFLNISVGIYREIKPSDITEMIEAMRADGIPTENNADLENDKRKAEHWATIGMGVAGYYRR